MKNRRLTRAVVKSAMQRDHQGSSDSSAHNGVADGPLFFEAQEQPIFMASPHGFLTVHWDHEPGRHRAGTDVLIAPSGGPRTARPFRRTFESGRKARRGDVTSASIPGRYHQNGAAEKVRGAVYTQPGVAAALTRWAVRTRADRVLDPACGEGVFLSAARTRLADLGARDPECLGVDFDEATAAQSGAICADFFRWVRTAPKVDVIVGNPPFIRSHLFPEASRALAFAEMVKMGLRPSRLMSTWAPFLALCCKALKEQGRLAVVIPEELLTVGYAEELRSFLLTRFRRVIVCFPSEGIFPE